jgi:Na+-driven multidrug efflux pump
MNNILRYEGCAAFAMIGLTSGSIINIFGDWFLMRRCGMGIEGAGISTAISQIISFLILLFMFVSGRTQSRFAMKYITKDISEVGLICRTGLPSMMRQGLSSISTMVLNGQAGLYGDAAVAAMSIVNRICLFVFSVALGIGQGFQPVSAFNYGAKKYKRVREGFLFTLMMGEILLGSAAVIGMFICGHLVGFFRDDAEVIAIGTVALRAQLIALFFQPLSVCANMLFQSIGKNGRATFLAMLRSGLYFIPVLIILSHIFGIFGIEISQTVADILTFFTSLIFVVPFLRELNSGDQAN